MLHTGSIQAIAFCPSSMTLASAANDKTASIHRFCHESSQWHLKHTFHTEKKPTAIEFNSNGSFLFISDRFGTVYQIETSSLAEGTTKLVESNCKSFGHLGAIMDLACTNRHIISADQECKIRVSELYNVNEINSFCLGHKSFVTKLLNVSDDVLFSASQDGTIRSWNIFSGNETHCYVVEDDVLVLDLAFHKESSTLLFIVDGENAIQRVQWGSDGFTALSPLKVEESPKSIDIDSEGRVWICISGMKRIFCLSLEEQIVQPIQEIQNWAQSEDSPEDTSIVDQLVDIMKKTHEKRSKRSKPGSND